MAGSYCIDIANLYETVKNDFESRAFWWQVHTVLTLPIYMKLYSLILKVQFVVVGSYYINIANLYEAEQPDFKSQIFW